MITAEQRFDIYLQYFIDGNVSLDYLKGIIVRDTILKTDQGKSLPYFPAFLVLEGDLAENIYDDTKYSVNSVAIKLALTSVTTYIEQSLFSQDIALLNDMAKRFEKAIAINNDSNARLVSELAKLDQISKSLEAQLLEAKKVYTAYDAVMSQFANSPDPVRAYIDQIQSKIDAEISNQSAIKKQLEDQATAKAVADQKAEDLKAQLLEQQKTAQANLTAQQESSKAEQEKQDAIYKDNLVKASESKAITENKTEATTPTTTEKKSSKVIPLVAGLGILAYFGLGGDK